MSATEMIYKIIDEKCMKQSAVARAADYDPKKFNALLRGRKKMTSEDVVPICKALGVTPTESLYPTALRLQRRRRRSCL